MKEDKGFTIIELILVIVLMGILSVTIAPKMFNSDGFQVYAYQGEVVTTLRNIQLKAMQQTNGFKDGCHKVEVTSKFLKVSSACAQKAKGVYVPEVEIEPKHNVEFQTTGGAATSFVFDHLGRPSGCAQPCEIILIGQETIKVTVESEGYVHVVE